LPVLQLLLLLLLLYFRNIQHKKHYVFRNLGFFFLNLTRISIGSENGRRWTTGLSEIDLTRNSIGSENGRRWTTGLSEIDLTRISVGSENGRRWTTGLSEIDSRLEQRDSFLQSCRIFSWNFSALYPTTNRGYFLWNKANSEIKIRLKKKLRTD